MKGLYSQLGLVVCRSPVKGGGIGSNRGDPSNFTGDLKVLEFTHGSVEGTSVNVIHVN